jgi:hypothetical protein
VRRLRGLLIALAVLAISAGAVLAGRALPQAAADGLSHAADASGRTVPASPDVAPTVKDESQDEDQDETETPEIDKDATTEQTTEIVDGAEHPDNHGALVSKAAQGGTPEGWRNHGEYVSAVARGMAQPDEAKPSPEPVTTLKVKPVNSNKPDKPAKPVKPTH